MFKVRTLRRCSIPERFDKEIFEQFASTPWNHRNDGQFYPKFLIPSTIGDQTAKEQAPQQESTTDQGAVPEGQQDQETDQPFQDAPSGHRDTSQQAHDIAVPQDDSMDLALPQGEVRPRSMGDQGVEQEATRRRLTFKQGEKRSASTPPVPSTDASEVKQARIASIYKLPNGEHLPISVNEDEKEVEYSLKEPIIFNNTTEFDEEELKQAMIVEKESIDRFDVKEEVPVDQVPSTILSTAMTLVWVHVRKGFVKSRLCV